MLDAKALAALQGLELRARYVMEGFLGGVHGSPFHGLSVEFRDYRDYQPGDDPRRVDWRLFARSDRLCVKRYEQETNARCYFLLDTSASMSYRGDRGWDSKIGCARVMALGMSWVLLRQHDAVGLMAVEDAVLRLVRPAQVPYQAGALMRALDGLRPSGGPVLARLVEQAARLAHRRSLIVLVSDLLDPAAEVAAGLERLRFEGHECLCLQVLDADEVDFPFADGIVEDVETGERRQLAAGSRERYRTRFDAWMDEYRRLFARLEMRHAVVRTDEDPGRALARELCAWGGR